MRSRARVTAALVATILITAACQGESSEAPEEGEIVLSCMTCGDSPTDVFAQYRHDLVEQFNQEYEGRYRIEILADPGTDDATRLQGLRRLALADDMPDLFGASKQMTDELSEVAELVDFAPLLEDDPELADSFYEGTLVYTDEALYAVPEGRDVAGVFYNTAVLEAAGISEPPASSEDFEAMADAVAGSGAIPLAMDGQWVTLLWLSHLIGTQDGGAEYLNSDEVLDGGFQDEALWIEAVEQLRDWHTTGWVNEDAYTGDTERANAPYITGDAATIVNGPWQISLLQQPDVLESTVSVPAPGDGVVVFAGTGIGGWASAATEPAEQEAVWEFVKFANTWDRQVERTVATGSYPAVRGEFTEEQRAQLPAANVDLFEAAADAEHTYRALALVLPSTFSDAWRNYWPAYVQGDLDTAGFLTELSNSIAS